MGVNPKENLPENDKVVSEFEHSVKFTGERYEVALLWGSSGSSKLVNNYGAAVARLNGITPALRILSSTIEE
mgnify:CR=1 FL=1